MRVNLGTDLAANVNFTPAGTGAVAVPVQTFLRSLGASPLSFGATGDGVADDTVELQAAFDSGNACINLGEGFTYKITDTVTVPDGVSVDFGSSMISYAGTRDRPAFVFGSNVGSATEATCRRVWVESETLDVSSAGYVGAQFINVQRTYIDIHRVSGFTHCIEMLSNDQGITGVRMDVSFIGDAKYALTLTVDEDGVGSPSYINGNDFFIEDWTNVVGPNGDTYGVYMRQIGADANGHNGNNIRFQTVQPGNGTTGNVRCLALMEDTGSRNVIRVDRLESGRGQLAYISGPVGTGTTAEPVVAANKLQIGLIAQGGGAILSTISQTGSARANTIEWLDDITARQDEDRVDDLVKKVKGYSSTNMTVTGGIHMTTGDGTPRLFQTPGGVETDRDAVRILAASRTFGRFVDIEGGDTFMIWAKTKPGFLAKLGVDPYDADGNRMAAGATAPATVLIKSDPELDVYNRWTSGLGGCYQTGSGVSKWVFTTDSTVKKLRYFVQGGIVQSFGIIRLSPSEMPLNGYSGLGVTDTAHYVSGDPTGSGLGVYGRGDIALIDSASGAALDAYQFTLGGRYAPAWAISTAYSLGQLRANGANVYEVTTAGTSADSGGPTGTGTGIVDGTVVWRYISALAVATLV